MKIIHTADLHLGQVIYQNYDRVDEHDHFFRQLKAWCVEEHPDALVVSGDVFDISQPSATVKRAFADRFVEIHNACPDMDIVIIAGNHDSASRIQEDSSVWKFAKAHVVGLAPVMDEDDKISNWENFVLNTDKGFIVALPYMPSDRSKTVRYILDRVAEINTANLPVVVMGHMAATGADITGHNFEIGNIQTQDISSYGTGYDYLALGHIHKPQTIGHEGDSLKQDVTYPSGVARYSGSALHVSCDEAYPHTVSVVEIQERGGDVNIRQLRIDELLHFHELPSDGTYFLSASDALEAVKIFADHEKKGYFRLRLDYGGDFPSNFNESIYKAIEVYGGGIRFNPKHIWSASATNTASDTSKPKFEIADIVQMSDPRTFIKEAGVECPGLTATELDEMFALVAEEVEKIKEENQTKSRKK